MNTLERPKEGKMIAGVAAALANYFHINVIFIRLAWVLLFLPGGFPGLIPYVVLWILIPAEKQTSDIVNTK